MEGAAADPHLVLAAAPRLAPHGIGGSSLTLMEISYGIRISSRIRSDEVITAGVELWQSM